MEAFELKISDVLTERYNDTSSLKCIGILVNTGIKSKLFSAE